MADGVSDGEVTGADDEDVAVGVSVPLRCVRSGVDEDGVVVGECSDDETVCVRIEFDGSGSPWDEVEIVADVGGDVGEGDVGVIEVVGESGGAVVWTVEDGGEVVAGVDEDGAVAGVGVEDAECGGDGGCSLSAFGGVDGDGWHVWDPLRVEALAGLRGGLPCSRWLRMHGLWLSNATKAERGERLAQGAPQWPVVKAGAHRSAVPDAAAAWLHDSVVGCLAQVVPNADAIASGQGGAEHVHQMRVGLRRLRTVLRELAGTEAPAAVREAFSQLGRWRDQDTVVQATARTLADAGAPPIAPPPRPRDVPVPQSVARDGALQLALLELTVQGLQAEGLKASEAGGARALARRRLQKLHRQVVGDAKGFESLPVEAQHRTRKRLKRLRYLAEFAAPAFDAKAVKRYLKKLEPAQDALGLHNDHAVAAEAYRQAAEAGDGHAWFAVGWLQGRAPVTARQCHKALQALAGASRFWKG